MSGYGRLLLAVAMAPLLGAIEPAAAPPRPPAGPICHVESKDDPSPPAKALLTGYGTGGFAVTTTSAQAQAYFDNGMQLAHAFAHTAATSAFKRAEQLDPTCAMCVWGEAWSRGPTLNYTIDAKEQAEAAALADKAAVLAAGGPSKERALIAALQQRYRDGGGGGSGDYAFARAMDDLARCLAGRQRDRRHRRRRLDDPGGPPRDRAHLDRAIDILEPC